MRWHLPRRLHSGETLPGKVIGNQYTIPISIDAALAQEQKGYQEGWLPKRPGPKLDMLPQLDENLQSPPVSINSVLKDVWHSQKLINDFYGDAMDWLHRDPEQEAWDDAVRWIAKRHTPPEPEKPIHIDWDWPDPAISSEERYDRQAEWDD